MNVGILTFHGVDNYGAVLQAWSTTHWLQQHGVRPEIIDYRPYEVYKRYRVFQAYGYRNNPRRLLADGLKAWKTVKRQANFKRFRQENLPVSDKVFYSFDELKEIGSAYDSYLCGSDQIWNPKLTRGFDPSFFLRFVQDGAKKIAFAPSVAIKGLSEAQIAAIAEYTADFHALSIREQETIDVLQPYCAEKIYQISDPVFLSEASDFDALARYGNSKKPFVFLYVIGAAKDNAGIIRAAEALAKRENCRLVYIIDGNSRSVRIHGKNLFGCNPKRFLGAIKNAKYVVSNSFHATAFSVLFQKQFYAFLKPNTGSRVQGLLSEFGLEDRICRSGADLEKKVELIDYTPVPAKLARIRQNSEAYLLSALDIQPSASFPRYDEESAQREAAYQALKQDVDAKRGKYLIARHRNEGVRQASRSGGVFTAVSDAILDAGGVVYGCRMEGTARAVHARAETKQERDAFRGSKYIQSEMRDCFAQVKADLQAGRKALFSGTGCQVAGLKAFLQNTDRSNLYTLDIVCHGVPSPYVWEAYLKWIENRRLRKVSAVDFRDKRFGWRSHYETVYLGRQRYSAPYFRILFYKHYILRPSCYVCPFASLDRSGDITIGDAWGIQRTASRFNDDRGCSLVFLNSERGRELFDSVADTIDAEEIDINNFIQPNLKQPSFRPQDREQFWEAFQQGGFPAVCRKYVNLSGKNLLKERLRMLYRRTVR